MKRENHLNGGFHYNLRSLKRYALFQADRQVKH